jgi:hypothetical protein
MASQTARGWANGERLWVNQPTLQNLGTGIVDSGAGYTDSSHHWPNLGFLVQIWCFRVSIPVVPVIETWSLRSFSARMTTVDCYAMLVQPTTLLQKYKSCKYWH